MLQLDEKTKIAKKNIPIKKELLNKYTTVEEIYAKEKEKIKRNILILDIDELYNKEIENLKINEIKKLAYIIFCNYHDKKCFFNDNNMILVNRSGIDESIQKIYHNRKQRYLIKEHLRIYSKLGKIIENTKLINQVYEKKGRVKYNSWNYYLDGVVIDEKEYLLEFEVCSLNNGENHYRIQRLELK